MGAFDNMNAVLVQRIQALIAGAQQAGFTIRPGSGYRSYERQAELYAAYRAGKGNLAAPPGRSNHNHGLAMDLDYGDNQAAAAWANANAGRYGLAFPVRGENWHVELVDGDDVRGYVQGAQGQGAVGFDMAYATEQLTPEQRQDQTISSLMDVMVGAHRDALAEAGIGSDTSMVGGPDTSAVASPQLAQDFSMESIGSAGMRQDTTTIPGAEGQGRSPYGPGTASGQWEGGVPPAGYVPAGKGAARWRPVLEAAMRYAGVNPTPQLLDLGVRRMNQESGGNHMAVNNWDSNAAKGDPTKGLMQNIGSAFSGRARELAGRGIFDGFANIVASIRYTLGRYGSLEAGWGKSGGY